MKNKTKIIVLMLIMLALSGCIRYGKGESTVYVYSVSDGIFWDQLWVKTSPESSEEYCHEMKDELKERAQQYIGQMVRIKYYTHLLTLSDCTSEEVYSIQAVE